MKIFYLIDGHAQIFRAYYAPFGQLNAPSGEPTKATHSFTQMILNLLRDEKPDYLAVALDHGDESTERKKRYPEYKANRERAPEDFGPQVDRIVEILGAFGVPMFEIPGQEADDIIATIATRLADEDVELRIVSRDKDLHQVLSDKVKLWDPMRIELIDARFLKEKYGYTPEMAVEIQTLSGDSTDNVRGIPGVGPKKALGLIEKYGDVAGVLEHVDELTPKMRENFQKYRDILDETRYLVTLNRDVDLDFDLEACDTSRLQRERLLPIFEELGFRRLMESIGAAASEGNGDEGAAAEAMAEAREAARGTFHHIDTAERFGVFLKQLREQNCFAVDSETTSLFPVDCDLIGLSFSWKEGEGWYLPLRSNTGSTLDLEPTLNALKPILEDPKIEKFGQNIKYDLVVLRSAGIELKGVAFDTMVASYLLNPERRGHGMDDLARDLLGYETIHIKDLIGTGKKQISMLDVDLEKLSDYAAEDADVTWRLYEFLAAKMRDSSVETLFRDVEMPLVEVLAEMELNGVAVDVDLMRSASERLGERIDSLSAKIHEAVGHEFSIDSPKQLAEVLFDEIGLRVIKKTKTSRSTDAGVLQTLAIETEHPLPRLVLEYRELTKLQRTYLLPLPGYVSPRTGRLHASFHQAVAATGRLSSSDPNLQNIPVRTEQGREIRRGFVAGEGRALLTADYSQIELRILAHLSKDPGLVQAFQNDQDIHAFVAAAIAGVPIDEVTREQRSRAKAVNFGIIYGQGAFGLAQTLGISRNEASRFIVAYKKRYQGIVDFMETCIQQAEEKGWVSTMLGRQRPIPEIASRNRNLRALGERLAINTVVQGSAADMIKKAMINIHRRIHDEDLDLKMIIQVHDELVFETPEDECERFAELVRSEMITALPLDVPVRVDVSWGKNWLEGKGGG